MDQRDGNGEPADIHRCAGEMQPAAISAGKEGETGFPPREAPPVSVISVCDVLLASGPPFGPVWSQL